MSKASTNPGRPRSFNEEVALTAAMQAFWANGFGATTYKVLEEATGLRPQSLVYAFGDKHALFEKALRLYVRRRVDVVVAELTSLGSPLANVRRVFDLWLADASDDAHPGCLLVNTASEFGASEAVYQRIVEQSSERLAEAFEVAFCRAQAEGELADHLDPGLLARLAVSAGDGALLHARVRTNPTFAAETFQALLDLLR